MDLKWVPRLVRFFLAFVAILTVLWLFVELIAFFFSDTWGKSLKIWKEGTGFYVLVTMALLLAYFRLQYARTLGLESEQENFSVDALPYNFSSTRHSLNRENVIATVRADYVDGILRQALPEQVRLNLHLRAIPNAVQRQQVLWEGQSVPESLVTSADIYTLFINSGRALLILGAPGSGKTITLVELCAGLLHDAEVDPAAPIPIILNLSTWADSKKPVREWITDEMLRQYGLARTVTPLWLTESLLCLLLDGLDEVRKDLRDDCVRAINEFRAERNTPLAVCSRSADYEDLSESLNLTRAFMIEPLNKSQIATFFRDPRLQLSEVYAVIEQNDALQELSVTPLILNIMVGSYQGILSKDIGQNLSTLIRDGTRRQSRLYDTYIRRAFERRPLRESTYSVPQALMWLRYIALQMRLHSETQFFIESLQPDWLENRGKYEAATLIFGILMGIVGGILTGALVGYLVSCLFNGLLGVFSGLLVSMFVGPVLGITLGAISDIHPVDSVSWEFKLPDKIKTKSFLLKSSFIILFWWWLLIFSFYRDLWTDRDFLLVFFFLVVTFGGGWGVAISFFTYSISMLKNRTGWRAYARCLFLGILFGMIGVTFGLTLLFLTPLYPPGFSALQYLAFVIPVIIVLASLMLVSIKPFNSRRHSQPNQSIYRSLRNALTGSVLGAFLGLSLSIILIARDLSLSNFLPELLAIYHDAPLLSVNVSILLPMLGGLLGALRYGGYATIQHYALRQLLNFQGLLPLRIVEFMNIMTEKGLIQRVGAYYQFIHPTFQEHVAMLTDEEIENLAASAESVINR